MFIITNNDTKHVIVDFYAEMNAEIERMSLHSKGNFTENTINIMTTICHKMVDILTL